MSRKFGDSNSGKSFSLRSGNKAPPFKMMGSSPMHGEKSEVVIPVVSDKKQKLLIELEVLKNG